MAACRRYTAGSSERLAEFWELEVDVNDSLPGHHAITRVTRDGTPSSTANVTLLHRRDDAWIEAYDAVGGTVKVTSTPAPSDAAGGASFDVTLDLEFQQNPVQQVSCQGSGDVRTGETSQTCTCRDSRGVTSTCVAAVIGEDCCAKIDGPTRRFTLGSLKSTPCQSMCAWIGDLPVDYCRDLASNP